MAKVTCGWTYTMCKTQRRSALAAATFEPVVGEASTLSPADSRDGRAACRTSLARIFSRTFGPAEIATIPG